jgi:hypothetical protein
MLWLAITLGYAVILLFVLGLCASARRGDDIHREVTGRWLAERSGRSNPERRRAA